MIDENNNGRPFIAECSFCGQGMLRFWVINGSVSALCDECELYWTDIRGVAKDPKVAATGTLDDSPLDEENRPATMDEIAAADYRDLVAGYSV